MVLTDHVINRELEDLGSKLSTGNFHLFLMFALHHGLNSQFIGCRLRGLPDKTTAICHVSHKPLDLKPPLNLLGLDLNSGRRRSRYGGVRDVRL